MVPRVLIPMFLSFMCSQSFAESADPCGCNAEYGPTITADQNAYNDALQDQRIEILTIQSILDDEQQNKNTDTIVEEGIIDALTLATTLEIAALFRDAGNPVAIEADLSKYIIAEGIAATSTLAERTRFNSVELHLEDALAIEEAKEAKLDALAHRLGEALLAETNMLVACLTACVLKHE